MPSKAVVFTSLGAVLFGIIYNATLKSILYTSLGVGRKMQPIEDFPYNCQRLYHDDLQACEDLWIDDEGRSVYAACSDTKSRQNWAPSVKLLNVEGRQPGGDHISVMSADDPGADGLYGLRTLKPVGYKGALGDDVLDLQGLDVEVKSEDTLRLYLVNQRPSVDANGKYTEQYKTGANGTVEVFDTKRGSSEMTHVRTVASDEMWSVNNVAHDETGGFFYTNDRSQKVEWTRALDYLLGGGNVGYCPPTGRCWITNYFGFCWPNGLVRDKAGLIYVPSSFMDRIRVMELLDNGALREVDFITTGMPIDNLSVDANGDIWAAAFPVAWRFLRMVSDPVKNTAPVTAFKIRKRKGEGEVGYEVEKMIEDGEGKVLGGVTTVRHDVKTGKLWMGSSIAPYTMVCDPK